VKRQRGQADESIRYQSSVFDAQTAVKKVTRSISVLCLRTTATSGLVIDLENDDHKARDRFRFYTRLSKDNIKEMHEVVS
jgi:hypothetical protein